MNDEIQALKRLKRRQREAADQIWGDSSLRDALNDQQAAQLLDLVVDHIQAQLNQTVDMTEAEAEAFTGELVTAVRQVLLRTNRLVDGLAGWDDDEAASQVYQFITSLQDLTGGPAPLATLGLLDAERRDWDHDQIFQRIMRLIIPDQEEE